MISLTNFQTELAPNHISVYNSRGSGGYWRDCRGSFVELPDHQIQAVRFLGLCPFDAFLKKSVSNTLPLVTFHNGDISNESYLPGYQNIQICYVAEFHDYISDNAPLDFRYIHDL